MEMQSSDESPRCNNFSTLGTQRFLSPPAATDSCVAPHPPQAAPYPPPAARRLVPTKATEKRKKQGKVETKEVSFCLTLSKQEIETDFIAITGSKPPPRRRKPARDRHDNIFRVWSLSKIITPGMYEVRGNKN